MYNFNFDIFSYCKKITFLYDTGLKTERTFKRKMFSISHAYKAHFYWMKKKHENTENVCHKFKINVARVELGHFRTAQTHENSDLFLSIL